MRRGCGRVGHFKPLHRDASGKNTKRDAQTGHVECGSTRRWTWSTLEREKAEDKAGRIAASLLRLDIIILDGLVVPQGPSAQGEPTTEAAAAAGCEVETVQARPHCICWARLLKRSTAAA